MNLLLDAPDQEFWLDETNRGTTIVPAFANAYIWATTNHRVAFSEPYLLSHGNPYGKDSFPPQEILRRMLLAVTYGAQPSIAYLAAGDSPVLGGDRRELGVGDHGVGDRHDGEQPAHHPLGMGLLVRRIGQHVGRAREPAFAALDPRVADDGGQRDPEDLDRMPILAEMARPLSTAARTGQGVLATVDRRMPLDHHDDLPEPRG